MCANGLGGPVLNTGSADRCRAFLRRQERGFTSARTNFGCTGAHGGESGRMGDGEWSGERSR